MPINGSYTVIPLNIEAVQCVSGETLTECQLLPPSYDFASRTCNNVVKQVFIFLVFYHQYIALFNSQLSWQYVEYTIYCGYDFSERHAKFIGQSQ